MMGNRNRTFPVTWLLLVLLLIHTQLGSANGRAQGGRAKAKHRVTPGYPLNDVDAPKVAPNEETALSSTAESATFENVTISSTTEDGNGNSTTSDDTGTTEGGGFLGVKDEKMFLLIALSIIGGVAILCLIVIVVARKRSARKA